MANIFSSWLVGLLGIRSERAAEENERLRRYANARRLFKSLSVRENPSTSVDQYSRISFNLARNSVDIGADYIAGNPVTWSIRGEDGKPNDAATTAASKIWDRSGGESKFLRYVREMLVTGDGCVLTKRRDKAKFGDDAVILHYVDVSVAYPEFDPTDVERLTGLVIAYKIEDTDGGQLTYMETWRDGKVTVEQNDEVIVDAPYTVVDPGTVPAVWLPNDALLSERYGDSDVLLVKDALEEFEHLRKKRRNIVDYFASPFLKFKGGKPSGADFIGDRKAFSVAKDGDIEFIEWRGSTPALDETINQTRQLISEITQTPEVAFGRLENAGQISGVALRLLYAPLLSKCRRKWSVLRPGLEKAMYFALRAEGIEVTLDAVELVVPDPLPVNATESWDTAEAQKRTGVSLAQILRERGYSDKQIAQNSEEVDGESEAEAKRFDAGLLGNTSGNGDSRSNQPGQGADGGD